MPPNKKADAENGTVSPPRLEIDYRLLAKVLPPPPELPLPDEPTFDPRELYTLTFGGGEATNFLVQFNKDVQTDITELGDLMELRNNLAKLESRTEAFPDDLNCVHQAMEHEQSRAIERTSWQVHELARAQVEQLAQVYASNVNDVRGACRQQLANAIGLLRGLLMQMQRRDAGESELKLQRQIEDLKTELREKECAIRLLRMDIERLELEKEELEQESSVTMVIDRRESDNSTSSLPHVETAVRVAQVTHAVQCDLLTDPVTPEEPDAVEGLVDRSVVEAMEENMAALKEALNVNKKEMETQTELARHFEEQLQVQLDLVERFRTENGELNAKLLEAQQQLAQLKQKLAAAEAQAKGALHSMNELLQAREDALNAPLMEAEKKMQELRQLVDSLREEIGRLQRAYQTSEQQLEKARALIRQFQSSSDSRNAAAIREQTLCAEISRLRQELQQVRQVADQRIRQLRQRLETVTEESMTRRTEEDSVRKLHTAAVAYANENPTLMSLPRLPSMNPHNLTRRSDRIPNSGHMDECASAKSSTQPRQPPTSGNIYGIGVN